MKHQCCECQALMREDDAEPRDATSHGLCAKCVDALYVRFGLHRREETQAVRA